MINLPLQQGQKRRKAGVDKTFLMYPRFIQMLLDDQIPDLPKIAADRLVLDHMNDMTLNRLRAYRERPTIPPPKRLFGHLGNIEYVAPEGKRWRHDDSDSDIEDIVVPDASSSDDDSDDDSIPPPEPQRPVTIREPTIQAAEDIVESDSSDSDSEFETVTIGSRVMKRKKIRSEVGEGSEARKKKKSVTVDADFVPDFASIQIPASVAPVSEGVAARPQAEERKRKGKELVKERKKKRIKIVQRTPIIAVTTTTTTTIPPTTTSTIPSIISTPPPPPFTSRSPDVILSPLPGSSTPISVTFTSPPIPPPTNPLF